MLQKGLEQAVESGIDWILCLDYDTMFSARHFDRLTCNLARHPEIDCLAALQPRRNTGKPLLSIKGDDKKNLTGVTVGPEPFKVTTAHFGFTIIRVEKLKDLPKPWFHSQPASDGSWTKGECVDDDISFWYNWRDNGRNVYVDPDCCVGHLEMRVSHYDGDGAHKWCGVQDWISHENELVRADK